MTWRIALLAAALVVCVPLPSTAAAQSLAGGQDDQSRAQRQGRRAGEPGGLTVQELERSFDRFELFEMQRALGLSDEEFLAVGERLRRIQVLRRRHLSQRRLLLGELRRAVASGLVDTEEAAVTARLAELDELGVRQAGEMRRAMQALDSILTVRQRIDFRLFQERFERRKLELLAAARQGRGGGPR